VCTNPVDTRESFCRSHQPYPNCRLCRRLRTTADNGADLLPKTGFVSCEKPTEIGGSQTLSDGSPQRRKRFAFCRDWSNCSEKPTRSVHRSMGVRSPERTGERVPGQRPIALTRFAALLALRAS